jgi:hypothetical protein
MLSLPLTLAGVERKTFPYKKMSKTEIMSQNPKELFLYDSPKL